MLRRLRRRGANARYRYGAVAAAGDTAQPSSVSAAPIASSASSAIVPPSPPAPSAADVAAGGLPHEATGREAAAPLAPGGSTPRASGSAGAASSRYWDGGGGGVIVSAEEDVVRGLESAVRKVLVLCGAYALGAVVPQYLPAVSKAAELLSAAWATCVVIIVVAYYRKWRRRESLAAVAADDLGEGTASSVARLATREAAFPDESAPLLLDHEAIAQEGGVRSAQAARSRPPLVEVDVEAALDGSSLLAGQDEADEPISAADATLSNDVGRRRQRGAERAEPRQPHPELENLFFMNAGTIERFVANSVPIKLENALFSGVVLLMIRTPDADGEGDGEGAPNNKKFADYFRDKQRRFELQLQLKFKRTPNGPLFFGCELDEPIAMGVIQRAIVNTALKFVKKRNNGFYYNLSDGGANDANRQSGLNERTTLGFTVDGSMDRLVATKPGEPIPKLGEEIKEDPASIKRRKKGGSVEWNTDDIYTMGLWSAYFDFLKWQCMNFPGIRPFSLASVAGAQPLLFTFYTMERQQPDASEGAPMKRSDCERSIYSSFEVSRLGKTSLGTVAKQWVDQRKEAENGLVSRDEFSKKRPYSMIESPRTAFGTDFSEEFVDRVDEGDDDENDADAAEEAAEELGEGMYLQSGETIALREVSTSGAEGGFVTNGGGFAVLQSQASSMIVIEKTFLSDLFDDDDAVTESTRRRSSKLIKSGDIVKVKLISKKGNDGTKDVKYLSLHRGWWLKWVSHVPKINGNFHIFTHETEGDVEMSGTVPSSMETQTTYLTLGGSFALRHRRWSRYLVGVTVESSPTFGGRMLGLHKIGHAVIDDEPSNIDEEEMQLPVSEDTGKGKKKMMMPLLLCADICGSTSLGSFSPATLARSPCLGSQSVSSPGDPEPPTTAPNSKLDQNDIPKKWALVDVPAWIEMMHRTKRKRQLAYVVRVCEEDTLEANTKVQKDGVGDETLLADDFIAKEGFNEGLGATASMDKPITPNYDENVKVGKARSFIRLRTGSDIAPILRLGLSSRSASEGAFHRQHRRSSFLGDTAADDRERKVKTAASRSEQEAEEEHFTCGEDSDALAQDKVTVQQPKSSIIEEAASECDSTSRHEGKHGATDESDDEPHGFDVDGSTTRSINEENALGRTAELSPSQHTSSPSKPVFSPIRSSAGTREEFGSRQKKQSLDLQVPLLDENKLDAGKGGLSNKVPLLKKAHSKVKVKEEVISQQSHENQVETSTAFHNDADINDESALLIRQSTDKEKPKELAALFVPPYSGPHTTDFSLENEEDRSISESDDDDDTMDEDDYIDDEFHDYALRSPVSGDARARKSKKWIKQSASGFGRVAKSVKSGTAITGKHVVKQGKKVKKGTVSAGRAIMSKSITVHGIKPPGREHMSISTGRRVRVPLAAEKAARRRSEREVSRVMKHARNSKSQPTHIMAGQLNAPDQSCRTASHVLLETITFRSPDVSEMVASQITSESELDSCFLRGGAVELGVVPLKSDDEKLVGECLAARCLWESHWREEWCGLYTSHLSFYPPLARRPSFVLSFDDVQSVRCSDPSGDEVPLPGLPLLVIETAWRCHYLAFIDGATRNDFQEKLKAAIFTCASKEERKLTDKSIKRSAHVWETFQGSLETSLTGSRGKWAPISSSSKSRQRRILNSRRTSFDTLPIEGNFDESVENLIGLYVEETLTKALSLSLDVLESSPDEFIAFLDATSRLRSIPIHTIDLSGKQAFCIFVNLYHCLMQHALLLAVDGLPNKRSVGHFMRCSCYEIGGDVFSLAELACCVIRGNMSRAVNPKSPYIEAPKRSNGHRFYALSTVDPRVNFLLNNGDVSNPASVPVLTPERLEKQMCASSCSFLENQLVLDLAKRTVILPKVCEVYRNDFGDGDPVSCLHFCAQYTDAETRTKIIDMLNDEPGNIVVKYHSSCEQFHKSLHFME